MNQRQYGNEVLQPVDSQSGFSIIEMLIAIVVVTVGLVSVVGISAYVSRTNSLSATLNVLAAAGQDQVDRLRTAKWTSTYTDPVLEVGGSVASFSSPLFAEPRMASLGQGFTAGMFLFTANPTSSTPTPTTYTYTLDADNAHHAVASGTPVGDLNITWQVRQGATTNLRYATIKVVQVNASGPLADGFTVTTIIVKN